MYKFLVLALVLLVALAAHAATCMLTVLGPDGKAVAGARVIAVQMIIPGSIEDEFVTDAAGQVRLDYGLDGRKQKSYDVAVVYQPGMGLATIALNAATAAVNLAPGIEIHGKVVDQDNVPVAGGTVQLGSISESAEDEVNPEFPIMVGKTLAALFSTETDATGAWRIGGIPATGKNAIVQIAAPGFIHEATGIQLPQFGEGATTVMKPACTIAGRAVNATGEPVAGVVFSLKSDRTGNDVPVSSEADGRFRSEQLEPGTYHLEPLLHQDVQWLMLPMDDVVTEKGKETNVGDIVVEAAARIHCKVVFQETQAPASQIALQLVRKDPAGDERDHGIWSDIAGTFEYAGYAGVYRIKVSYGEGCLPQSDAEAVEVSVAAGETKAVTIQVSKGATLTGKAVDDAGAPAPAVPLEVSILCRECGTRGCGRDRRVTGKTDENGAFSISGLPGSAMQVWVPVGESSEWDMEQPLYVAEITETPVTLTLRHSVLRALTGRVVDDLGTLLPDVSVTISVTTPRTGDLALFGYRNEYRTTDEQGRFELKCRDSETVALLSVKRAGYQQLTLGKVEGPEGERTLSDSVMSKMDGTVAGKVVDADGKPVAGAIVVSLEGTLSGRVESGKDGAFTLKNLPRGEVTVLAATAQGSGSWQGNAGEAAATLTLRPAQKSDDKAMEKAILQAWKDNGYQGRGTMAAVYLKDGWDKAQVVANAGEMPVTNWERMALLFAYLTQDPAKAAEVVPEELQLIEGLDELFDTAVAAGTVIAKVSPEAAEYCFETARPLVHNGQDYATQCDRYCRLIELAHLLGRSDDVQSMLEQTIPIAQSFAENESWRLQSLVTAAAKISPELAAKTWEGLDGEQRNRAIGWAIPVIAEYDAKAADRLRGEIPPNAEDKDYSNSMRLVHIRDLVKLDSTAALQQARTLPKGLYRVLALTAVIPYLPEEQVVAAWRELEQMNVEGFSDNFSGRIIPARHVFDVDPAVGRLFFAQGLAGVLSQGDDFNGESVPGLAYAAAPVSPEQCRVLLEYGFHRLKESSEDQSHFLEQYPAAMMAIDPQRALEMAKELPKNTRAFSGMMKYLKGNAQERLLLFKEWGY